MDAFEQVNEEIRQQQRIDWLKKNGWPIALIAAILVALVLGWRGWQAWETSQMEKATDLLLGAMNQEAALPNDDPSIAAAFYRASQQEPAQAARLYQDLAQTAPPIWREFAMIAYLTADFDNLDGAALRGQLAAFDTPTHPWRGLAWELLAADALRHTEISRARNYLTRIIEDEASPSDLRGRAERALTTLSE
ncbi:MAG: tetratricopeptide repeat protein [Pseudomonadota bacterium]